MPGLAVGSGLNGGHRSPNRGGGIATLSALVRPVLAPLFAGQTIRSIPGYATFLSPENYVTTAREAEIASVEPAFRGVADADTPLAAGGAVSVAFTVRDTAGTTGLFDAGGVTVAAAVLSAIVAPAMAPLTEGQSLSAMAGFDTMTAPENFVSTAGAILSVEVTVTGDATAVGEVLIAGQTVGVTVRPFDEYANTAPFDAGTVTVAPAGAWDVSGAVIHAHPLPPMAPTVVGALIT